MDWEFAILNFFQTNIRNPVLDVVMVCISTLGKVGIIWILFAIITLITKKYRRLGTKISAALIITLICCSCILKPIVNRIRPYDLNPTVNLLISKEIDTSFPSGHTFFAFSVATACFMYNKKLGILMYAFAFAMAFSRIYLYMHFPTDVLFGMIFGIIVGIFASKLENYIFDNNPKLDNKAY